MKYLLYLLCFLIIVLLLNQMDFTVPTKRSEMASTLLDNKIYVAGGINFWGSNNSFEVYDIDADSWKRLPNLPGKLNHIGLAASKEKVYLSGGFYNALQTKFSNHLYCYNVKNKRWDELAKMPDDRAAHIMIYRNDYLHLIGGRKHKAIWSYHLKSQSWETDVISPLPEKRDHISVLQDEQNLYVVGGRKRGRGQADCWVYNFEIKKWTTFTSLATPRGGQSACLHNHQIHIIGGEDLQAGKTYAKHDIFDLDKKQWHEGKPMKIGRHGFISELVANGWYIFGGGKKASLKTVISTTDQLEIMNLLEN